jgi:hypothetical protein
VTITGSRNTRINQTPLKDRNRLPLIGILVANLAVLILAVRTGDPFSIQLDQISHLARSIAAAGVGIIFVGIANGILHTNTKARLVFWRWHNPLPGSFAFTHYASPDPRIDVDRLKKKIRVKNIPTDPQEQNSLWYQIYRSVANEPSVIDAHRSFLLTRDFAAIAFLLLLVGGTIALWEIQSKATASLYVGLLLLQYLVARQAAQNYGVRLVTSVLALKASNK